MRERKKANVERIFVSTSFPVSLCLSLSLSQTHTHSRAHTHTLTHTHTRYSIARNEEPTCFSFSLSHTHTCYSIAENGHHTNVLQFSRSLSLTHTLSRTHRQLNRKKRGSQMSCKFLAFSLSHTHTHRLLNRRKQGFQICCISSRSLSHTHTHTHTQATQSQETGIPNVLHFPIFSALALSHAHTGYSTARNGDPKWKWESQMCCIFLSSLSHTHTHTDYSIAGNGDPKCLADGSYNNPGKCVETSCPPYDPPAHGSVSPTTATEAGQYVNITCDSNYDLEGIYGCVWERGGGREKMCECVRGEIDSERLCVCVWRER